MEEEKQQPEQKEDVWCDVVVQTGLLKEAAQRFVDVLQSVVVATGLINGLLVPGGRLVGDGVRTYCRRSSRQTDRISQRQ